MSQKSARERGQTAAGAVVEQYVRDCPDVPSARLAKYLRATYPSLFASVEEARSKIRYYRGNAGDVNRKTRSILGPELFRPSGKQGDGADMWDDLPAPIDSLSEWRVFDLKGSRALIMSDTHIPFHSLDAVRQACAYGHGWGVDTVILNGDIVDFYAISRWEIDPRLRNLKLELESTIQFLALLRRNWPEANIYYKMGNHEERYNAFMRKRAPELLGIDDFEFEEVMMLEEFGIEMITSSSYGMFGDLPILHGHEFGKSVFSPVNPARGYWLRAKESMLGSHYHKSSSHHERTLADKQHTTFSIGCLCDLHPAYAPMNSWNLGFALAERTSEYGTEVMNKKIVKGKVMPV